jgi:hypothetical protein
MYDTLDGDIRRESSLLGYRRGAAESWLVPPQQIAGTKRLRQLTLQRRETAIENQLQVAQVTLRQNQRRESLGFLQQLGLARQIARKEVLEDAAVGSVGHDDDGGVLKGVGWSTCCRLCVCVFLFEDGVNDTASHATGSNEGTGGEDSRRASSRLASHRV